MKPRTTMLHPKIEAQMRLFRDYIHSVRALYRVADDVEELLDEIGEGSTSWAVNSWSITIHYVVQETQRELVPLFRALAKRGYRRSGANTESPKHQETLYHCGKVKVRVTWAGVNCRYVQVGEKLQPIMEFRCTEKDAK